jgi:tetratricopeptide (TPR) repeat protein
LLFEKVIEINPKGGCRARLGLAEISLRTRNFVQAEKWATDGLENGKFQAKTLSAWPILISARRNIGKVLLSNTEVARLKTNCKAPVGRRAMQLVVTELRKSNDPLWKTLATDWLQCDGEAISPAIAYCFRRMLASSAENEGRSPQEKLQHAMGMWKTGSLSLLEQISSARAVVSSLLALKSEVTETQFISRAKQDFGKEGGDRMSQAIAELLFRNGYQEKAIAILEGILATTPEGSKRWGRSTWRLAKFQNEMGDNAIAGDLFLRIAEQEKIPARIRNFSLTEALRSAAMAGADDIIQRAKPLLGAALGKIDDPRLLMDISRQLGRTADCAALAMAFRKKGETGAKEAIKTASTPDQAVFWLFHLARRQNDWGDFDGTIALWESMDANRRLWLWSPQTHYWEFLGYVLRAYGWKEKLPEAETLAREFVDDPATPAEGMAILGNSYANVLIYNDRTSEALEVYRRIVTVAPMHGFSSFGYYWLALDSMKRGQTSAASSLATQALACLDERSQLGWILDVRLRSLIIKELAAGITESEILTKFATTFPEEKVKYQLAFIAEDLTRLP